MEYQFKAGVNNIKNILFVIGFFLPGVLIAQEPLIYIVEKDNMAYHWEGSGIKLNAGDRITMSNVYYYSRYNDSLEFHLTIDFKISDTEYSAFAQNLRPANTIDIFGKDIFIDYPLDHYEGDTQITIGNVDEMWVPDYYCDVLASKTRNRLIEIRPGLDITDTMAGDTHFWYDDTKTDIQNGRAMFYNSAIKLGLGLHFAIKNIKKTNYGYNVDCVESTIDGRYSLEMFTDSVFWNKYQPGDKMTLLLYLDGDFLDIYVDNNDILLGTFVKVKKEFIKQYQSLIKTNTCDLTNVSLPKRADGSTDYTLPELSTDLITTVEDKNSQSDIDTEKTNTEKSSMPMWALIAIIGVFVAVSAGTALFVVKRRK